MADTVTVDVPVTAGPAGGLPVAVLVMPSAATSAPVVMMEASFYGDPPGWSITSG